MTARKAFGVYLSAVLLVGALAACGDEPKAGTPRHDVATTSILEPDPAPPLGEPGPTPSDIVEPPPLADPWGR